MKVEGLKARSVNSVLLECTVCGELLKIRPQRSLRTFTAVLNRFKRTHRICSAKVAARAARRKRMH